MKITRELNKLIIEIEPEDFPGHDHDVLMDALFMSAQTMSNHLMIEHMRSIVQEDPILADAAASLAKELQEKWELYD